MVFMEEAFCQARINPLPSPSPTFALLEIPHASLQAEASDPQPLPSELDLTLPGRASTFRAEISAW